MNLLSKLFAVLFILNLLSCGTEPAPSGGTEQPANPADSTTQTNTEPTPSEPSRPTCKLVGSVLEGNMFWAGSDDRFVVISAEEETKDKDLGESHRILSVYDGTCKQLFRQVLPVNFSADYPYYLTDITYNKVSKQVGIRGWYNFYLLDLATLKLSAPLMPKFLNERYAEDAQSGSIKRLELWENYIVGFAASKGPFVFDISNPAEPTPMLPAAEFTLVKGENYNSLFLLKSTNGSDTYQALAPDYDYDKEELSLNVMYDSPKRFSTVINKSFRNNRYLILNEKSDDGKGTNHAIDMKTRKAIDLPADIATKKDTDIIAWLKQQ